MKQFIFICAIPEMICTNVDSLATQRPTNAIMCSG
jgi:hypothetical protein